MKKSIKTIVAGLLAIPVLALGLVAVPVYADNCDTLTIQNGASCTKGAGQQDKLFGETGVFTLIINAALYVLGAVSVLMLVYGGVRYTISGGESKAVTDAKNTILYAIIGLIVAIMAYAIVNFVLGTLVKAA